MAERLNSSNQAKNALKSSGVQASDPVGAQYDASQTTMRQIAEFMDIEQQRTALGLAGETYDERGFLGGLASETTASRQAKMQQAIFNVNNTAKKNARIVQDLSDDLWTYGVFTDEDGNEVPFKLPENMAGTGQTADYYLRNEQRYEKERTRGMRTGWTFKGVAVAPSALADLPTSTSNWRRPRTVAAGYDYNPETDTGVLTVVFRDGTFYNYYDVPAAVWIEFHNSFSKGPMLNRKSKNGVQAIDGKLLAYKHGPADMSNLSPTAQEFLYKVARTVQIYNREAKARINAATGKAHTYKGKETRGAPQNSRVRRRRDLNRAAKVAASRKAGQRRTP